MPRQKFSIYFAFFPYGGNGAAPSEHPAIRNWFANTLLDLKTKYAEQVSDITWKDFADTPVTMTRNAAAVAACEAKADILVMIDSDNIPDLYLTPEYRALYPSEAQSARPFMEVVLEQFEKRWSAGPISICAPYCGPPPHSPVYVFKWEQGCDEVQDKTYRLRMFERSEASIMSGVGPCAAQPTGCIAMDTRLFKLCEPDAKDGKGWFYYEYKNGYNAKKCSTEDVTCTRDLALMVQKKLGYNPLLCAWDCWAGHVKPVIIGKPSVISIENVEPRYRKAVLDDVHKDEKIDAESVEYVEPEVGDKIEPHVSE